MVVYLPGDVNMHSTPLPGFLEQERVEWSEKKVHSEKTTLHFLKAFIGFGQGWLFHETRALRILQLWLSAALPSPGPKSSRQLPRLPREPEPGLYFKKALKANLPGYQGHHSKARSPLCVSSLPLVWCQLAEG